MGIKKKKTMVDIKFFYIISSRWFPMHHEISALNRVFHDDIKSRNDLGGAREIRRVIVPKKIILIFFHYRLLKRMILNKMNEPPSRHHVWIAWFCHLIFICNDPNPKEKLHLDHPILGVMFCQLDQQTIHPLS